MEEPLTFLVYESGRESARVAYSGERMVIGRGRDADITVREPGMSSVHAEVVPIEADDGLLLRDLKSLNGTYVNGDRIVEIDLLPGDEIEVGRATIVLTRAPAYEPAGREDFADTTTKTVIPLAALRTSPVGGQGAMRMLLLRDLSEAIKTIRTPSKLLAATHTVLEEVFSPGRVFVLLPDGDEWKDRERETETSRASSTVVAEAASHRSAVLSKNVRDDTLLSASESISIQGIETVMAAPVTSGDEVVAVLYIDRQGLPRFDNADLSLLGLAANHVSSAMENASHIRTIERGSERLEEVNQGLEREVDRRTAEVRQQSDEIARLARAREELLGVAAHDLRSPLQTILGMVEIILMTASTDAAEVPVQRDDLVTVGEVARGMAALLNDLLDAKAIESGMVQLDLVKVSLREVFAGIAPACKLAARQRNVELRLEVEPELHAELDARRLGQALTNLTMNAIKFSESGKPVIVRAQAIGEEVVMSVTDFGRGIAATKLENIFAAYVQAHDSDGFGEMGGSGLGLAIARRLVELHRGTVTVESELGKGSCFTIRVPKSAQRPSAEAHQATETHQAAGVSAEPS